MANKIKKSPLFGNLRSHALNATRRKQNVNYQKIKLDDGTSIVMSARDIRTLKKLSQVKEN